MNEDIFHLGVKALIRNEAGDVLLLQVDPARLRDEDREYWDLPGGRVQKKQSVLETLKREVAEETGMTELQTVKPLGIFLSNLRIPLGGGESVGLILSIYECKVPPAVLVTLSEEHIAYKWFSPKQAGELLGVKYPAEFCQVVAGL